MPLRPFALHVPADPILRPLAGVIAGRYFELCGGSAQGLATFAAEVQLAVDAVTSTARGADVSFAADTTGVEAVVSGGAAPTRLRTPF